MRRDELPVRMTEFLEDEERGGSVDPDRRPGVATMLTLHRGRERGVVEFVGLEIASAYFTRHAASPFG